MSEIDDTRCALQQAGTQGAAPVFRGSFHQLQGNCMQCLGHCNSPWPHSVLRTWMVWNEGHSDIKFWGGCVLQGWENFTRLLNVFQVSYVTSFLMEPIRGSQFGCCHCQFMDTKGVCVVTYPRWHQKWKLTIYECERPGIRLPDWTNSWLHIYGPGHMHFWRSSVLAIVSGMPDGLLWSSWIPWKLQPNSLFQPWGLGSYFQSGR